MPKLQSQQDQRRLQAFRDQHERKWTAYIEKESGDACTPYDPCFAAPWYPEQHYIEAARDEAGTIVVGRVTINYQRMKLEREEAWKAWTATGRRIGFQKYGSLFNPDEPFRPEILDIIGKSPKPPELAVAALQGNRWLLGLKGPSGEIPKRPVALEPFFRKPVEVVPQYLDEYEEPASEVVSVPGSDAETWPAFLAEQRRVGKTAAEAGVLWRQRTASETEES